MAQSPLPMHQRQMATFVHSCTDLSDRCELPRVQLRGSACLHQFCSAIVSLTYKCYRVSGAAHAAAELLLHLYEHFYQGT